MKEIQKILVPVDFSKNSNKILEYAASFAKAFGARITVVHVTESFDAYAGFEIPHISIYKLEEELQQGAVKKMAQFVRENSGQCENCDSVNLFGSTADEIKNYAQENGFDLIIIGTHGHKGMEKIIMGSVADRVVKGAPCPVLVMNPYH